MAVSLREVICFGRYEPLFRVAAGGMAEVYAARIQGEAGFQKLVAVKRMLPHLARDPGFVDMFLNEAKLAAHVASPHVVQTLDLGRGSDGSLYIVMELVVGLSLAKLVELSDAPIPTPIVAELLAQAAQGLDDAHEATTPAGEPLGLIHRDVSPHNVLVGIDGRARVTDFGIARAVNRPRPETNIRELKGKFAYMSPEQTRLWPLDRRSDVFSLGIILWELLTGTRLFAHRDPLECVRLVQAKPIPSPAAIRSGLPPAIAQVAMRALERDRNARFQSAGELATALRRAARACWGEPPDKKEIAAFVEATGGEELARLMRLIRLGTEGADADAIEAVQPGITRVLPEDASGVAPVGTGARRTAVLESNEEDELGPPTVLIVADREEAAPETAMVSAPPSDEGRRSDPTTERPPPRDDLTGQVTRVAGAVAPAGSPPAAAPKELARGPWITIAAIVCALSFGVGLALVLVWPSEPRAILPAAPPEVVAEPAPFVPAPVLRTAPVVPPPPVAPAPAIAPPPSAAAVPPAPSPAPAPVAAEVADPPIEARGEPEARRSARGRRDRRRRPGARSEPAAPRSTSRDTSAPILDVGAFDRRPR